MNLTQKILIVDDKKENLVALRQVLHGVEAEIIEASSGNEALAATLDHRFAMAILDVMMPGMSGFELAAHLRGDDTTRLLPIVFVTAAYPDEQHVFSGYEAGCVDYIVKPFAPEILLAKVRIFLELDRQRRELQEHRDQLEMLVAERTRELTHELAEHWRAEVALKRIEWMLSKKPSSSHDGDQADAEGGQGYRDLTALNRGGLISSSIDRHILEGIASEYLDLMETSTAICEKNGDYALAIFSSRWCRLMNQASRKLCDAEDNVAALGSGKWLCHESCWTSSAKQAIETRAPVDVGCHGGIRLYAEPIFAGNEVIGAINFSYGDPPQDPVMLRALADSYGLDHEELIREAHAYDARPPFITEVAKKRLKVSAGLIGTLVERKQAEDEKEKLQAQLNQAQKMEAIGVLAGGIAHDFNNILAAIMGYTEISREDADPDSQLAQDLNKVLTSAHRAKDLVNQILAFSRETDVERIPIKIQPLVKESLKMLRASIPTTITIREDIYPRCGAVLANPTQIHQIVMNLCTNAFHAMEQTGGVLSVEVKMAHLDSSEPLEARQLNPGDYVELTVRDTGTGIGPDIIEKIFDPYFTTKEIGRGTGLGLSISHGIIKSYGGAITVESTPGQGTTFHVYFPVVQDEAKVSEEIQGAPRGRERILFVDDEELLVRMCKKMLERLGYTVTAHSSSIEALAAFSNAPAQFDLVITDQTMPELTGVELTRRLLRIRPDLPVILCTGFSNLISEESAKAIGIREFALKPLSMSSLALLVRKLLDGVKH
ncbi:MAG: response regulator [Deltaproteobacteria bacterium]|nr:response regulator [Deltaproteobacteria bacterium]